MTGSLAGPEVNGYVPLAAVGRCATFVTEGGVTRPLDLPKITALVESACQGLGREASPEPILQAMQRDLYEGGNQKEMLQRTASLVASGVQMIALLALNDDGAPSYDHHVAEAFAAMGIPSFACTPALFPDLMAQAIQKQDLGAWAARQGIVVN